MKSAKRAPERQCRLLALVGVFEVPQVKLVNGLFGTKERSTSVPTAEKLYDRGVAWHNSFMQGGSAVGQTAGGELVRNRPHATSGSGRISTW